MTSPPPPVSLPVPVPQPAESPRTDPVRWRFRPRWPAVAVLALWAAAAVAVPVMRQQDARAVAAARAGAVAAGAAARLDAVVAVVRAAAGENHGPAALPAVTAALSALAPGGWLGAVRTDAYGAVAESRGTVRPAPAILRAAVIAARPTVTVDAVRGGSAAQPVVVAVPVTGPGSSALVESVVAAVLHPRVWQLDGENEAEAALLAPGCVLLAARPAGTGVMDQERCRTRLASPSGPAGLGRLGDGTEWAEVARHPVQPQSIPADGGGGAWTAAVPVRGGTPAALMLLWGLGPAGVVLLGMPAGLPGMVWRRWRNRRTAGRA